MLKISHIITGLENGGAENMLLKLLIGIDKRRFDVNVISLTNRGVLAEQFEAAGVPVVTCNMQPGKFMLFGFISLLRHLHSLKPDIIQTWLYHADMLGGIAGRLLGIHNIVWNIRQSNLDSDMNKLHTLWTIRINAWLSGHVPVKIICNSYNAVNVHYSAGFKKDKFILIPNGFDTNTFKPDIAAKNSVRDELNLPRGCRLIGIIARFDPQKNHKGFCEAAGHLFRRSQDVYFILVGKNITWENGELVSWIESNGLPERVRLLGPRSDIARLTAALDIAVCSSYGEGFPNVIGEAMACGVPCVVTNVGDCAEIVGDTGWVVMSGDMVSLADRVAEALSLSTDEINQMGQRARARITTCYALKNIIEQYEQLYDELA
ncbi:MAG: glycosyltransferase family 4 protein [Enterobacteriaceae bacterium]